VYKKKDAREIAYKGMVTEMGKSELRCPVMFPIKLKITIDILPRTKKKVEASKESQTSRDQVYKPKVVWFAIVVYQVVPDPHRCHHLLYTR
jgi:hypothetical protein